MKRLMLLSLMFVSYIYSKHIKIVIASNNIQKIFAVKTVFNEKFSNVNDMLEFINYKSNSRIPEQPIGLEVALQGAKNRLNSIPQDILTNADYAVSIESYIEQSPVTKVWNDIGLVLLKEKGNSNETICLSNPTFIPEKYVTLAQKMSSDKISKEGFNVTIGQAIAKNFTDKNIDSHDWHKEKEFGGYSRQDLLKDTIYKAVNIDQINTLKKELKYYKDFPKPGITFIDFLPILSNPKTLQICIDLLFERYKNQNIDVVVGLESRGFILAAALAIKLNAGFVPVRKPGKLPCEFYSVSYQKEYGSDTFTLAKTAIQKSQRVLIIDDLIATGGSARAAIELVKLAGGIPVEFISLLQVKELSHLTNLGIPFFNLID